MSGTTRPTRPLTVIILGPYRSGTSITSRILASLGVDFGPQDGMIPPNEQNPSGYFERNDINAANDRFIASAGGTLEAPGSLDSLLARGDLSLLQAHDLVWMRPGRLVGIKDPRMCATLECWFAAGRFERDQCRIVHVTRGLASTLESSLRHGHVAGYAGGDPARVRRMLETYADLASQQIARLGVPALRIAYEDLIASPGSATTELALFLGVENRRVIRAAAANIGKQRALSRLRRHGLFSTLLFRLGAIKARLRTLIYGS